jgi:hypothetical protein
MEKIVLSGLLRIDDLIETYGNFGDLQLYFLPVNRLLSKISAKTSKKAAECVLISGFKSCGSCKKLTPRPMKQPAQEEEKI